MIEKTEGAKGEIESRRGEPVGWNESKSDERKDQIEVVCSSIAAEEWMDCDHGGKCDGPVWVVRSTM
jgi:hypothetical protein